MKLAVDVSKWQRGLPISHYKDKILGVLIRTSDGILKDYQFENHIAVHKKYPIILYHYWRANYNVDFQVHLVLQSVEYAKGKLGYKPRVAVDVENTIGVNIVGKATAIKRLYELVSKLDEALEDKVMIYTSETKWKDLWNSYTKVRYKKEFKYLTNRKLWNAVYFSNEALTKIELDRILEKIENGLLPWRTPDGEWKKLALWQIGYTTAIIDNAQVDVNIVYDESIFEYGEIEKPEELTLEERVERLEEVVAKCCPNP